MTEKIRVRMMGRICLMALAAVLLAGSLLPVFGAEPKDRNNMPSHVKISVKYAVKGSSSGAGATFVLAPVKNDSPMPTDAVNGEKTIRADKAGTYSFGTITFTKPEVHEYIVARSDKGKRNIETDASRFKVKVLALNDGTCPVIAYRNGEKKKSEIKYTDVVKRRSLGLPKTGDAGIDPIYLGMFICSSIALLLFAIAKRHEL